MSFYARIHVEIDVTWRRSTWDKVHFTIRENNRYRASSGMETGGFGRIRACSPRRAEAGAGGEDPKGPMPGFVLSLLNPPHTHTYRREQSERVKDGKRCEKVRKGSVEKTKRDRRGVGRKKGWWGKKWGN